MYYIRISNEIVTLGFQSLNKPHGKKKTILLCSVFSFFFLETNLTLLCKLKIFWRKLHSAEDLFLFSQFKYSTYYIRISKEVVIQGFQSMNNPRGRKSFIMFSSEVFFNAFLFQSYFLWDINTPMVHSVLVGTNIKSTSCIYKIKSGKVKTTGICSSKESCTSIILHTVFLSLGFLQNFN